MAIHECIDCGQLKPRKARGRCQACYDKWKTSPQAVAVKGRCAAKGCRQPRRSRGLCDSHYQEWRASDANPAKCQVPECDRPVHGHRWCSQHLRKFGSPATAAQQ